MLNSAQSYLSQYLSCLILTQVSVIRCPCHGWGTHPALVLSLLPLSLGCLPPPRSLAFPLILECSVLFLRQVSPRPLVLCIRRRWGAQHPASIIIFLLDYKMLQLSSLAAAGARQRQLSHTGLRLSRTHSAESSNPANHCLVRYFSRSSTVAASGGATAARGAIRGQQKNKNQSPQK